MVMFNYTRSRGREGERREELGDRERWEVVGVVATSAQAIFWTGTLVMGSLISYFK